MSHSVDVSVRRGGKVIDSLPRRPIRVMSSGDAGVVYGGMVFPLHRGNFIDVQEESSSKGSCLGYVEQDESIPYAPVTGSNSPVTTVSKWYVETNQFGNYLVFDGSESTARDLVELMESTGLGVRRWDRSVRAADDGYTYDWFIRLEFQGGHDECVRRIGKVLGTVGPRESQLNAKIPEQRRRTEQRPESSALELENRALQRKIRALEEALAAEKRASKTHRELLSAMEQKGRQREAGLSARLRMLEAAIGESQDQVKKAREMLQISRASEKRALAQLQAQGKLGLDVEAERASAAEWEKLASEYADDADNARRTTTQVHADLEELRVTLRAKEEECGGLVRHVQELELDLKEAQRARPDQALRLSVDAVFEGLWPSLQLDPDSFETIATGFPRPGPILRALNALANGTLPCHVVTCRDVKESDGIREVKGHFPTGDADCADMGRLYYRCLPDGRKFVLVHKKKNGKEQERTWRRFAARDLAALAKRVRL